MVTLQKSLFLSLFPFLLGFMQGCTTSPKEGIHGKLLTEVLPELEKNYDVKLIYTPDIVEGLKVYTNVPFTVDMTTTLDNVLKPLGLIYSRTSVDTYTIVQYEVNHKRTIEQGGAHLDSLLTLYPDSVKFNERKEELRTCFYKALGINPESKFAPLNPVFGAKTVLDGYTVENVAFESMPGYYVTGNLYRPLGGKAPFPVILCPYGHFYNEKDRTISQDSGRYAPDLQTRCAVLAKMGAVVLIYDMYSWCESAGQTGGPAFHYTPFAQAIQTWNSIKGLDFLLSLPGADKSRVGVTGASGGGTQTILVSALDQRVTASVPVVMVSSSFDGGCECESGLPVHSCGRYGTDNAEIAAMTAPRPQLIISEDCDWTRSVPGTDFPYLQKVYALYGKTANVENVHLHDKHHDYGYTKRVPMYRFFATVFGLNLRAITGADGKIDEHFVTIQDSKKLRVFPNKLPTDALRTDEQIRKVFAVLQE